MRREVRVKRRARHFCVSFCRAGRRRLIAPIIRIDEERDEEFALLIRTRPRTPYLSDLETLFKFHVTRLSSRFTPDLLSRELRSSLRLRPRANSQGSTLIARA